MPVVAEAALAVSIVSACISLGSLVSALFSAKTARNASRLAASSQWASEVTKLVIEELENATADDNLVRLFCTVPFKSKAAKNEHRRTLNDLRDASQKRVFLLDTLTDHKTEIQATKAARDKVDDSFWDTAQLQLAAERGDAKLSEYRAKAELHVACLKKLMNDVSTHNRLEMLPASPKALPAGTTK